jgi:flagellar hook assembly protein FlgD
LSFQYAPPTLADGTHTIEVRAADRLGNGPATKQVSFDVTSDLSLENVLSYPNPMATETDFTFVLSRPSEVTIRIFTISGRLIRILEERSGRAGYNQVHWDGLDSQGRSIANGTYLYTVTADDGDDRVKKKEALIVYR